uniref:Uncharacterized protein n=1 Tax=Timema poppense TaxID=170557 RepID=A0A7R9D2V4_TIMPO|nr:unnamed protein product [Timema poppensis]
MSPCLNYIPLVRNELDCYATQHQLESNRPSLIHTIMKPEQDNNVPAPDVCGEHSFKEEMCFDQSSFDVSENNIIEFGQFFTEESKKNSQNKVPCLKLALSKALGYGIIAGSVMVRVDHLNLLYLRVSSSCSSSCQPVDPVSADQLIQFLSTNCSSSCRPVASVHVDHLILLYLRLSSSFFSFPTEVDNTSNYSSPITSLVLSDSSELKSYQTKLCIPTQNHMICNNMCLAAATSDSQNLVIFPNVDCQKSAVICQSAPKKPRGYCNCNSQQIPAALPGHTVPQILKILQNKSAKGLSIWSILLDLFAITSSVAYQFNMGFPFRMYEAKEPLEILVLESVGVWTAFFICPHSYPSHPTATLPLPNPDNSRVSTIERKTKFQFYELWCVCEPLTGLLMRVGGLPLRLVRPLRCNLVWPSDTCGYPNKLIYTTGSTGEHGSLLVSIPLPSNEDCGKPHDDAMSGDGETGRASDLKHKIEHIGCNERWPDWSDMKIIRKILNRKMFRSGGGTQSPLYFKIQFVKRRVCKKEIVKLSTYPWMSCPPGWPKSKGVQLRSATKSSLCKYEQTFRYGCSAALKSYRFAVDLLQQC